MRLPLTLSLYLGRIFALWFSVFFLALAAVIFIADTLEILRRSARRPEVDVATVLELAALKLPHTAQSLLPFAILFGGVMAFWRLTRSQELVVARAVGVSVWRFMAPAMIVAALFGVMKVAAVNPIAAAAFSRYEAMDDRLFRGGEGKVSLAGGGLWLRQKVEDGRVVIHARAASQDLSQLRDVLVLQYDAQDRFTARIDARSADLGVGYWRLADARRAESGRPPKPIGELFIPTDMTAEQVLESFARPETMSFWSLYGFIATLEESGFSAVRHRMYFQGLLASPLLLAAMVLIAAACALRPSRRGGVGKMIASGVAAGFLLYFLSDLVYALGLSQRAPAALAAWAPAAASTMLGVALLLHLEDG